jgi:hypothetical protein
MYNPGTRTFTAGEALENKRRVKLKSGSTTTPPEVEYADAGEQHVGITEYAVASGDLVAIKLRNADGTHEMTAAGAFAFGAVLYGAADGKVDDASSGSSIAVAVEAATADGDIIEAVEFAVLSTTAATVSIADAGSHTAEVTVEGATQEIYQNILSVQNFIPVLLASLFETDGTNLVALLGIGTTPVLDMAGGDADSSLEVNWVASNSDAVLFQVPLPPSLDVGADLVIHFRAKSGGATDTPTIASDAFFNEGDTKIEDVSSALGAAFAENTITIANGDIPTGAQTLTVELTPGAHTTDTVVISSIWIEHKNSILTS